MSCGPVDGITVAMAALPLGLGWNSVAITMPGVDRRAAATWARPAVEPPSVSATISMGPLDPGPKPSAVRS